jgi:hypothetical protein
MTKSELEQTFWYGWLAFAPSECPSPEREAKIIPSRQYRFDFAWRDALVCASVEGQMWGKYVRCSHCGQYVTKQTRDGRSYRVREAGGRHFRGSGLTSDAEKYNLAASLGYVRFVLLKPMLEEGLEDTVTIIAQTVLERIGYGTE